MCSDSYFEVVDVMCMQRCREYFNTDLLHSKMHCAQSVAVVRGV